MDEWAQARADLLVLEKQATHQMDAVAARRRRLPMVRFRSDYVFEGPDGPRTLLDLFDGRQNLIVYQFMDRGPGQFCPGCTQFTDNIPNLTNLNQNGVSWANISNMPLSQIEDYKALRGWTVPFLSSHGTDWTSAIGVTDGFLLVALLRDGDDVYLTYTTTQRGVDRLMFLHNMLDLTAYGRQQKWEDSPEGWPQEDN
jgi:predicted dithiol-disulfide oxidoreductase (DUF899 family)